MLLQFYTLLLECEETEERKRLNNLPSFTQFLRLEKTHRRFQCFASCFLRFWAIDRLSCLFPFFYSLFHLNRENSRHSPSNLNFDRINIMLWCYHKGTWLFLKHQGTWQEICSSRNHCLWRTVPWMTHRKNLFLLRMRLGDEIGRHEEL